MAPLGMVTMLGGFSTPEVGVISLVVFLVLSITLTALCARCKRNSGNAYDVNGTKSDGATVVDGNAGITTSGTTDPSSDPYGNWRGHTLPPSTLDRAQAQTN